MSTARPDDILEFAIDRTFHDESRFGSIRWVAAVLGLSMDNFRKKQRTLTLAGFPTQDPITNSWIKADVEAWIIRRRKIADSVMVEESGHQEGPRIDEI